MFPYELLARAIEADRAREIEHRGRVARLLDTAVAASPAEDRVDRTNVAMTRDRRRGAGTTCEPA